MAATRKLETREHHRSRIARWLIERPSMQKAEMAVELKVSRQTVHEDVNAVLAEWRRERLQDTEVHADRAKATIASVKEAGWTGWHRSIEEQVRKFASEHTSRELVQQTTEAIGGPMDGTVITALEPTKEHTSKHTSITTSEAVGDPRFLKVVLDAQKQESELLGLNQPLKVEHSGDLDLSYTADPEWLGDFMSVMDRMREQAALTAMAQADPHAGSVDEEGVLDLTK